MASCLFRKRESSAQWRMAWLENTEWLTAAPYGARSEIEE
jgi:hypothetical protein